MRRIHVTLMLLALAVFAIGLAAAGLSIGVVHVSRRIELRLFAIAGATALSALSLLVFVLVRTEPAAWAPGARAPSSARRRRLRSEWAATRWAAGLLMVSLAAGLVLAMVRSRSDVIVHRTVVEPLPHSLTVAIEHLSRSHDLRVQWLGIDHRVLIAGLIAIALVAVALAARRRWVRRAALVGAGTLSLAAAAALTFDIGGVGVHPRLDIAPTLKVERPTLFSLQLRPHVTVRSPVTVQLPGTGQSRVPTTLARITLLSLDGLRISLHPGGKVHCDCEKTLPPTR